MFARERLSKFVGLGCIGFTGSEATAACGRGVVSAGLCSGGFTELVGAYVFLGFGASITSGLLSLNLLYYRSTSARVWLNCARELAITSSTTRSGGGFKRRQRRCAKGRRADTVDHQG